MHSSCSMYILQCFVRLPHSVLSVFSSYVIVFHLLYVACDLRELLQILRQRLVLFLQGNLEINQLIGLGGEFLVGTQSLLSELGKVDQRTQNTLGARALRHQEIANCAVRHTNYV